MKMAENNTSKIPSPASIERLAADTHALSGRVTGIEGSLGRLDHKMEQSNALLGAKIDELSRIVTTQAAQPRYQVTETLDTITKCVGLLLVMGSVIVAIATSISAAPLAKIDVQNAEDRRRIEKNEKLLDKLLEAHLQRMASK